MLSSAHVAYIWPHAHADYVAALTSEYGWSVITHYGINADLNRLAGFLANCSQETGCGVVDRESLRYLHGSRLKTVWPSRFRSMSDAEMAQYLSTPDNPDGEMNLACFVYNGRMQNRVGTTDGYDYRGGGFLQTTGREDWLKYGRLAGIDFDADPSRTNDKNVSLLMSCAEWSEGRCNEYMDMSAQGADGFGMASAVINVGSPKKISATVGLAERRQYFAKISKMFGLHADEIAEPAPYNPDVVSVNWQEAADAAQDAAQDAEMSA